MDTNITVNLKNEQKVQIHKCQGGICEEEIALYPPLFSLHTWTKTVPICHRISQESPSMCIGRNYRIELEKRLHEINILRESNLSSKIKPAVLINSEKLKLKDESDINTKNNSKSSGFVTLGDLLSGKYYNDKLKAKEQEMITIKKKKEIPPKKPHLPLNSASFLQLRTVLSPDEQFSILINKWNKEKSNKIISIDDKERIKYYLNEVITNDLYDPYPEHVLESIKKYRVRSVLLKKYYFVMMKLENEIRKFYDIACRKILFDYVTMDPNELKRLKITNYYISNYSSMLIRGPVPWHHMMIIKKEQLRKNVFVLSEPILMLHNVWKKYSKSYIFPINNLKKAGMPIQPGLLKEFLEKSCEHFRHKLINEWIVECADLFVKTKESYQDILQIYDLKASKHQIQKLFDCAAAIMSRQLRKIVYKSLKHILNDLIKYKNGNTMVTEYEDKMFINLPFFVLKAVPYPNSTKISFEPTQEECLSLLLSIPRKIINSAENIPRVDRLLIKEFKCDSTMVLKSVHESEEDIKNMLLDIATILDNNFPGPETYIKHYETYSYLLNGTETEALNTFFENDPFPLLSEFSDWLVKYANIYDDILKLKDRAELNLIILDVSEINKNLKCIINSLKNKITDYHMNVTLQNIYEINNTFEVMSAKSSVIPDTAEDLVKLSNYVNECQDSTLAKMKGQLRSVGDYIMFLFEHTEFNDDDINLLSRVFRWPQEMEQFLEIITNNIIQKKVQLKVN